MKSGFGTSAFLVFSSVMLLSCHRDSTASAHRSQAAEVASPTPQKADAATELPQAQGWKIQQAEAILQNEIAA